MTAADDSRIVRAEFLAGAAPGGVLPGAVNAEIAFAGRSNVGKSSLLNALVERKNLVRTSNTPGATRQINLFEAAAKDGSVFHLVDLPGYGFAKRSKAELGSWKGLIESYLSTRPTLRAVVLIVDIRRGVEADDRELVEFIEAANAAQRPLVRVLLVVTKIDKLSKSARGPAIAAIGKACKRRVIGFSAETGEGREELWAAIRREVFREG